MPNAMISEVVRGSSSVTDFAPYFKMQGGQTGGPFTPGTLASVNTSGQVTVAVANDKNVIGAFRLEHLAGGAVAGAQYCQIGYDRCALIADTAVVAGQILKAAQLGRATTAVTSANAGQAIGSGVGALFANQPTGDSFQVLSSSASDTTQTVTVYFTRTGLTNVVSSQVFTLTGTTAITSALSTIQNILAVVKSAATVGTVTVRKTTGPATTTTLAPATLTSGIIVPTSTAALNAIPTLTADAADTSIVGILGTGTGDAPLSSVIAATGTTAANFGAVPFKTVSLIMVGAATVARTFSVAVAATADSGDVRIGRALESAAAGQVFDAFVCSNR